MEWIKVSLTWFCLLLAQKNPNVATKSTITAWVSVFSLDFGPQYFSKMVTTSKNCSDSDSWLIIACNEKDTQSANKTKKKKKKTTSNQLFVSSIKVTPGTIGFICDIWYLLLINNPHAKPHRWRKMVWIIQAIYYCWQASQRHTQTLIIIFWENIRQPRCIAR